MNNNNVESIKYIRKVLFNIQWEDILPLNRKSAMCDVYAVYVHNNNTIIHQMDVISGAQISHYSGSANYLASSEVIGKKVLNRNQIIIDLEKIPPFISKIYFFVSTHRGIFKLEKLKEIKGLNLKIIDTRTMYVKNYQVSGQLLEFPTLLVGAISRENNWTFTSIMQCKRYSISECMSKEYQPTDYELYPLKYRNIITNKTITTPDVKPFS